MKKGLLLMLAMFIQTHLLLAQHELNETLHNNILRDAQKKNPAITEIREVLHYNFLEHIFVVQFHPTGWCLVAPQAPDNYRIASNYFNDWYIDLTNNNQVNWYKSFDEPSKPKQRTKLKSDTYANVSPLLTTAWSQFCMPGDKWGDNPTPVSGCVATAMAQIIRYFEYPVKGYGNMVNAKTYKINEDAINTQADFSNAYNYSVMPSSKDCNKSKAELLFECGVLAQAKYGITGSGIDENLQGTSASPPTAVDNMVKYLNYSALSHTGMLMSKDHHALIMENLSNNIPILVSGESSSGGAGHAYVLDGYDADQGYHCNLGWGGLSNGYYPVDKIKYKKKMVLYLGLKPYDNTITQYPYKSDLFSLKDWDHRKTQIVGRDEINSEGYVEFGNKNDALSLTYEVPEDQDDMSLIIDLETIRNEELTGSPYSTLEMDILDYHGNKVNEKHVAALNTNNNSGKYHRVEYKLNQLKGHTIRLIIKYSATHYNNPHKYLLKNVEIKRVSNVMQTNVTTNGNYIEVMFSSKITEKNYNLEMFTIYHGDYQYHPNRIEVINDGTESSRIRLYSQYKAKKYDEVWLSYKPDDIVGYILDKDGLSVNRAFIKIKADNTSQIINNQPVWKAITCNDPKAICKIKLDDPDGDIAEVVDFGINKEISFTPVGDNTYYVYENPSPATSLFWIYKVKDFSNTYQAFLDLGSLIVTDIEDQLLPVLKLYPNPTSGILHLNNDCERINIYQINGQLIKSLDQYLKDTPIDMADLKQGIYILEAVDGDKKVMIKFIKN